MSKFDYDKLKNSDLVLGKNTNYNNTYHIDLLHSIPRSLGRGNLINHDDLSRGVDVWNCYEFSWLDANGKPCVALIQITVPACSAYIVESKSLKLYLNSFSCLKFESKNHLLEVLQQDLAVKFGSESVDVKLFSAYEEHHDPVRAIEANVIDFLNVKVKNYSYDPALLRLDSSSKETKEVLCSHLLKTNCLITNQPDWATVYISYQGSKINHESLLKYIISFRNHNEFHEQCVERIFSDVLNYCGCNKLSVYARYTRRGGIDINPFRSNFEDFYGNFRVIRQ